MSENPVEPVSGLQSGGEPAAAATTVLTQLALQYLDQTRPWVRFMSILAFLGSALMALAGLAIMVVGMAGGLAMRSGNAALGAIGGAAIGFFYLVMACLYIAPGVFLHRYAGAIKQLKVTGAAGALEDALKHQKSFWRFVGIMSAVGVALGVIALLLAVVAGIIGAMMAGRR